MTACRVQVPCHRTSTSMRRAPTSTSTSRFRQFAVRVRPSTGPSANSPSTCRSADCCHSIPSPLLSLFTVFVCLVLPLSHVILLVAGEVGTVRGAGEAACGSRRRNTQSQIVSDSVFILHPTPLTCTCASLSLRSCNETLQTVLTSLLPSVRDSFCDVKAETSGDLATLKECLQQTCSDVSTQLDL